MNKEKDCSQCSRRQFYQLGYKAGQEHSWIVNELPVEVSSVKDNNFLHVWITTRSPCGDKHVKHAIWHNNRFWYINGYPVVNETVIAWMPEYRPKPYEERN